MKKKYYNKFIDLLKNMDKEKLEKLCSKKERLYKINYVEEIERLEPLFKKERDENYEKDYASGSLREYYKMYCGILFFD